MSFPHTRNCGLHQNDSLSDLLAVVIEFLQQLYIFVRFQFHAAYLSGAAGQDRAAQRAKGLGI